MRSDVRNMQGEKPCKYCGVVKSFGHFSYSRRDGYKTKCKECVHQQYQSNSDKIKAQQRSYRQANAENLSAKKKIYYAINVLRLRQKAKENYRVKVKDRVEQKRIYRQTHREICINSRRKYKLTHRAILRERTLRYRRRIRRAKIRDFTANQWEQLQILYNHRCVYCHQRNKGTLTRDHIIPVSKGGNHTWTNIVPACRQCNGKKFTGPPLVPIQSFLFLE